jgi:signal transduction histidine kinase
MSSNGHTPIDPASDAQAERLHQFAHDLKNRIGGLWEAMRLLGCGDEAQREEIRAFAERSFFGAQREVEVLLDEFAVDRTPRLQPVQEADLREIALKALAANSFRLQRKEQPCEVEGPSLTVRCDAQMITELLQAVLSNASKFSAKGSPIRVVISSTGDQAHVDVIDQGVGLTEDDMRSLFQRYAILSSRSTDGEAQLRGTLSRARQWAAIHGGSLTAASEGSGEGTCFRLRLPINGPSAP